MAEIPFSLPLDMPTREALDRQADLNARRIAQLTARLASSHVELAQLRAAAAERAAAQSQVPASSRLWTPTEQAAYVAAVARHGPRNWTAIAAELGTRSPKQIRAYAARAARKSAANSRANASVPQPKIVSSSGNASGTGTGTGTGAAVASPNIKPCEARAAAPLNDEPKQGKPVLKDKYSVQAKDRSVQKPGVRQKQSKVQKKKAQSPRRAASASSLQESPALPTPPRTPRLNPAAVLPVSPVTPSRPGRAQGYKCLGMYSEEALRAARLEEARRQAEGVIASKDAQNNPTSLPHSVSASLMSSFSGDGSGAISSCSLSSDCAMESISATLNGSEPVVDSFWSSDVPEVQCADARSCPVDTPLDCFPRFPPELVDHDSLQTFQKDIEELESFSLSAIVPNQTVEPFDDILV